MERPTIFLSRRRGDEDERVTSPVEGVLADFAAGASGGGADRFDAPLAADVLWGSPFGAVVEGWAALNAVHRTMMAPGVDNPAGPASRYEVEQVRRLADDVAVAFVRRFADPPPPPGEGDRFDELALLVLARRDGRWWVAAAQHVPDRRAERYG